MVLNLGAWGTTAPAMLNDAVKKATIFVLSAASARFIRSANEA
jgi:hypothetical protein